MYSYAQNGLLCGILAAASLAAQPGAHVTDTMRIEIDKRIHTARKINGRWWSEDNRQLSRTNVGWLWTISGGNAWKLVRFDHHYPVDPSKVELLDRSMGPDQVRSILGSPNSVFPSDRPEQEQHWDYYGANGYKLAIMFGSSGGIFTADYEPDAHSMPKDVPHLAFRFNGKTAREAHEEARQPWTTPGKEQTPDQLRAQVKAQIEQSRADMAQKRAEMEQRRSGKTVEVSHVAPSKPLVPARRITADEIKSVTTGMPRTDVIKLLGDPMTMFTISGDDGARETLMYATAEGPNVSVVLLNGKVAQVAR